MVCSRVYITKEFGFEASHHLCLYEGKCSREHGHSYKMQVTVSRLMNIGGIGPNTSAKQCMVMDFGELKEVVEKEVLSTHDHDNLNKLYIQPTAELMVGQIFETLRSALKRRGYYGVKLESVKLWETDSAFAEYRGEEA